MHGLNKTWMGSELVAITATAIAAATTAATATAATTIATTTTATTTATAIATRRTFFARTRNVDAQVTALQILFIEHVNRLLGFFRGAHFNKGKPAGAAGEFVEHQLAFDDGTSLLEQLFKVAFGGTIGQIAYI